MIPFHLYKDHLYRCVQDSKVSSVLNSQSVLHRVRPLLLHVSGQGFLLVLVQAGRQFDITIIIIVTSYPNHLVVGMQPLVSLPVFTLG